MEGNSNWVTEAACSSAPAAEEAQSSETAKRKERLIRSSAQGSSPPSGGLSLPHHARRAPGLSRALCESLPEPPAPSGPPLLGPGPTAAPGPGALPAGLSPSRRAIRPSPLRSPVRTLLTDAPLPPSAQPPPPSPLRFYALFPPGGR